MVASAAAEVGAPPDLVAEIRGDVAGLTEALRGLARGR